MKPLEIRTTKPKTLEVQLGPPVVAWLAEQRFEVFQEVDAGRGVADLVATSGPRLVVVELKRSLSWELLSQARRWRGLAHQTWVAVPRAPHGDGRLTAINVFADNGIGVLEVVLETAERARVDVSARPAFDRRARVNAIRRFLHEAQKTYLAAGSASSAHWSTFRATCELVRKFVAEHEGAPIGEVVAAVKHHYASDAGARGRLVHLIRIGEVPGLRVAVDGRTPRLFTAPEVP